MYKDKRKPNFLDSEEEAEIRRELQSMMESSLYTTKSSFTPNVLKYPNNSMTFLEKHMNYIYSHPRLDTSMYVANLRLMTLIR